MVHNRISVIYHANEEKKIRKKLPYLVLQCMLSQIPHNNIVSGYGQSEDYL